jgi:N-acetyl-gamma-glutamylphosphate reductase
MSHTKSLRLDRRLHSQKRASLRTKSVPRTRNVTTTTTVTAQFKFLTSELVADPEVDVIYVATPHSHHYENVKSALNAGKHVLCEKPFTGSPLMYDLM